MGGELAQKSELEPVNVEDGIWYARIPLLPELPLYVGWVVTSEGVVVVDTGFRNDDSVLRCIRQTTDKPIRYIIYTHYHSDHTSGARAMMVDQPVIIGHVNVVENLKRKVRFLRHTVLMRNLQVGQALVTFEQQGKNIPGELHPTLTYQDTYRFTLGGQRFDLIHAKGETDCHTIVHLPDRGVVFPGDLYLGVFPNLGNPFKVQRYAKEWYEALDMILSWRPRYLIGGHAVLQGEEIEANLKVHSEVLRYLEETVVAGINAGKSLEELLEEVKLPEHLSRHPSLRQTYSRIEFAIRNIHKRYCGFFDYNPAHLLPRPSWEITRLVRELIGDDERILQKARSLGEEGRLHLALQVLDLIVANEKTHRQARAVRREILAQLAEQDETRMSRGVWEYYRDEDGAFLRSLQE